MTKPVPPVSNPHCQPQTPHDLLLARAAFMQKIRLFFGQYDFLEVETPALIPQADPSPHLSSFSTWYKQEHHIDSEPIPDHQTPRNQAPQGQVPSDQAPRDQTPQEAQRRLYLRTSPEFAMKQLVAAGYPRIFQICKFFRNGEITPMHNPEFTGLEWYETGCDYTRVMDLTEAMCRSLWPQPTLTYQGCTVDLESPWERLTIHQAFARYAQLELPPAITREDLALACHQRGLSAIDEDTPGGDAWDDLFFKLMLTFVEPHLGMKQPTFLMDYPIQMAALARAKPGAPHIAERVELYIAGVELANGYSELTDPHEQRRRMEAETAHRQAQGEDVTITPDPGLLNALAWGMPPTAGIAVGLDRLLMLQRDAPTLQDVLPFPLAPSHQATN